MRTTFAIVICTIAVNAAVADDAPSASEIFERRVLPIVTSEKASSCSECHFGGVDLKSYVREDQAQTFAALRDAGLIDVKAPDESKLLSFIRKHGDKTDPLLAKVRHAELEAFKTWIRAAVAEPELLTAKSEETRIGSTLSPEVIRHVRKDRVLRSFHENIWSEIGRCLHCHSPESNQRLVEKHGEQMSWIKPGDPAATLAQCVEQGIIDLDEPEESEIVLKPLMLIEHGGGPKFAIGSRTDKNFRRFLVDYAKVVNGEYATKAQLPEPAALVTAPSGQFLRITHLSSDFGRKLLRVELYSQTDRGWSETPCGVAENPVNGKRGLWQSPIFNAAARNSERGARLDPAKENPLPIGRYLVRIFVDRKDNAKKNRDYEFTRDDLLGEVTLVGDWPVGYKQPKIIQAPASDPQR